MSELRICGGCRERKPRTSEFWHLCRAAPDKLQYRCRTCMNRPGRTALKKLRRNRAMWEAYR